MKKLFLDLPQTWKRKRRTCSNLHPLSCHIQWNQSSRNNSTDHSGIGTNLVESHFSVAVCAHVSSVSSSVSSPNNNSGMLTPWISLPQQCWWWRLCCCQIHFASSCCRCCCSFQSLKATFSVSYKLVERSIYECSVFLLMME
ncbi:hypothetical protein V8G54_004365 [Vigna mungo]|uniref:Uncharacterized protein n=1 Tax=Vigna mungo TaxID=3915 RepID=A0AAQ3PDC1_VIGMU